MRLYAGTSQNFIEDTVRNQIGEKLRRSFFDYFRYNPSDSEVHSWNNSLVRMKDVIQHSGLTDKEYGECGILRETQGTDAHSVETFADSLIR